MEVQIHVKSIHGTNYFFVTWSEAPCVPRLRGLTVVPNIMNILANAEYVKWVVPPRLKVVRQTETPTVNRV